MSKLPTDYLFPKMSWLTGAGTVINLFGRYYSCNYSGTEEEADSKALSSDWSVVGDDIWSAVRRFKRSDPKQLELDLK
jgi:hypothetical protein